MIHRAAALLAPLLVPLLAAAQPAQAQTPPPPQATPLFASDMPIRFTLQGPLGAIAGNRESRAVRAGTLTLDGGALAVGLSPRGITRLASDICDFPPLRVDFTAPPPATSLFAGQRRLKLVTHCRRPEGHQQHLLLEFAAYRIFNLLTPLSMRARLATIDYLESSGRPVTTRIGFFLEDIDDTARRNAMVKPRTADVIAASALSGREAGRAAMFNYMIGNLDWSMRAGPEGEGCCHNFRLLQKGSNPALVAVPYDYDFSGFVDAPYATPPENLPVASVRVRKYRGYCAHNGYAAETAAELRAKRPEITAMIAALPGISPASVGKATAYLDPFWTQVASDASIAALLRNCVR